MTEQSGDWRKGRRRATRLALRGSSTTLVNASFFTELTSLANTIKNLAAREGHISFPGSSISEDIALMLNQLRVTFDLLCFINADETREEHPFYRVGYSFVTLPLIRTLIDGFYNITLLLDDPSKARAFRLSGYKRMLASLKEEEELYGNEIGWPEYIAHQRYLLRINWSSNGIRDEQLKQKVEWLLLSRYLQSHPAKDSTHKKLMRRFVHGPWREYSEISHVTFRGVYQLVEVLNFSDTAHQRRPAVLEGAERSIGQHLGRAATILLALLTEIQVVYRFKGHNVNARLHAMWRNAVSFYEGEEIFNLHYKELFSKQKDHRPS